jgi:hypothetical protein
MKDNKLDSAFCSFMILLIRSLGDKERGVSFTAIVGRSRFLRAMRGWAGFVDRDFEKSQTNYNEQSKYLLKFVFKYLFLKWLTNDLTGLNLKTNVSISVQTDPNRFYANDAKAWSNGS